MTRDKSEDSVGLWHENCLLVWGNESLVGESIGGTFPGGEGISEVLASGGGTPPFPPIEETLLPLPQEKTKKQKEKF